MKSLINSFETAKCKVEIFDTQFTYDLFKVYCVKSLHKASGKVNIRFGTMAQVKQIVNTYHLERRFKL